MSVAGASIRPFQRKNRGQIDFTAMGFGAAPLGNYRKTLTEGQCDETLQAAWNEGIRYYDTAPLYGFGLSEQRVGRLLRDKPRSEYVLSTKVGRLLEPCAPEEADGIIFESIPPYRFVYDYSYDGVMRSYEDSQKRIGVDRFDLLLVHDIDSLNHGSREEAEKHTHDLMNLGGWKALEELRAAGDVKSIGVGVNEWEPCKLMLELADPDLFLLAGRYTLLEHAPLQTLFPQCAERGVGIILGGPYNSGVLAGRDTYNYFEIPPDVRKHVAEIQSVCDQHGVTMPAAALQFVLAHPLVVSVIPGSQTKQEVLQNMALLNEQIPVEFWKALKDSQLLPADAPTPE